MKSAKTTSVMVLDSKSELLRRVNVIMAKRLEDEIAMPSEPTKTTAYPLNVGSCLSPEGHAWRQPWPEYAECTRCRASITITNQRDGRGATVLITEPVISP